MAVTLASAGRITGFSRFYPDNYLNDHKAIIQNHGSVSIPGKPGETTG
jgi:hypothetical protein